MLRRIISFFIVFSLTTHDTFGAPLGGPSSVTGQIAQDDESKKEHILPLKYLKDKYNLTLGADFNFLSQHASSALYKENASGSVSRIYGKWGPFNVNENNNGYLVFKVEHRNRIATDISPQFLAQSIGMAGLTAITWSNAGNEFTNFYWMHGFDDRQFGFIAGIVDVTDYLDVYGLVNPWTEFNNMAFATNPTIVTPNQGLGGAAFWRFNSNYYVLGGIADANGDPTHPGHTFSSFFDGKEYFKHIELGWIESWDNRFNDNIHISGWGSIQASGVVVSFSRKIDKWIPFLRAGYAHGLNVLVNRTISFGTAYEVNDTGDQFSVGANWSNPPALPERYTAHNQYILEVFYRKNIKNHLQITPSIQYIHNPAYNPVNKNIFIPTIKIRLYT